ncbi:MAG: twin-arginine translocation signal domain-containing protein [Pedosphaera sp.]|nr:twin-arginine translocation signal domain-containing protein [Pedosphaera sp.]
MFEVGCWVLEVSVPKAVCASTPHPPHSTTLAREILPRGNHAAGVSGRNNSNISRREFLRTTATAAVGLAALGSQAAAPAPRESAGLIDTNVSLGRWPFRRLPLDETPKLVAKLRRHGVTQAWAGSFEAAFGTDLATANARLVEECRKHGRGLLVPFGSVNLAAGDWEMEFNRCVEKHRMRGLRLFPNYHGYKLDDPAFKKLLSLCAGKKLAVQIAADLEDERTQPASAAVPHVDAKPLPALLKRFPTARVMLLNWQRSVPATLVSQLAAAGVGFDIATLENVGGVAELIGKISPERVMFGSHAPFFYFESALLKLKESALSETQAASVRELNARRWLA